MISKMKNKKLSTIEALHFIRWLKKQYPELNCLDKCHPKRWYIEDRFIGIEGRDKCGLYLVLEDEELWLFFILSTTPNETTLW